MPPLAVLFDFDGVLADTENVHIAAWERTFAYMGMDVGTDICARAAEIDDRVFLREVFDRRGIDEGDVEGWVRRKQELTMAMLADCPRLYPGAEALVRALSGRVRMAVVTGTWRANVEGVLRPAGLLSAFERIFGKEDVAVPKPDPAVYELAVEALGVPARGAVALEDSPTGLESARAAGVRCVAVGQRHEAGPWSGDAPFVADLRSTREVLRVLGVEAD